MEVVMAALAHVVSRVSLASAGGLGVVPCQAELGITAAPDQHLLMFAVRAWEIKPDDNLC
ncbi:hypothetical protein D3C73_925630 [compost metagenome]